MEAQLRDALALSSADLRDRAAISDYTHPGHLREEALVYLIREAHRRGDEGMVNEFSDRLLRRCARRIEERLRSLGQDASADGNQDVVAAVFAAILDLTSDKGDFLQVRFWPALDRRISDAYRAQARRLRREAREVPLSRFSGADGEDDAPAPTGRISPDHWSSIPEVDEQWVHHPVFAAALAGLPLRAQQAFVLKHAMDWPIYSDDPMVMTISRALKVTDRTIRTDLRTAEAHVAAWRQGASHLR